MFRKAVLVMFGGVMAAGGCATDDPKTEQQEIIDNLVQAGYPRADIEVFDGAVYVQKDALVTLEASREMLETIGTDEQYRTTNLVAAPTTICVTPTSQFAGSALHMQGLALAIENYNQQNLTITLVQGPASGCNSTITAKLSGGTGGSAGFPSGGKPYTEINIGRQIKNYGVDVLEHVITHELGHCVGFRHSDYYDRSISCGGSPSNEGDGGVGAILITGTPATATRGGSVMNACYRTTETGEWSSTDITALNALY
ncbi:MAG TPA: M57 family metalloprotease [Kofleriaceae bacterium]|nr:M57 family metalloprotease [Kofleriaceae bacterium]